MPRIEIYTKEDCPFCHKAKELLREKGQKFIEIDVERDPEKLREMLERSRGRKTVPEIFIDGKLIGGFDELRDLANSAAGDGCKAALAAEDYLEGIITDTLMMKKARKSLWEELSTFVGY